MSTANTQGSDRGGTPAAPVTPPPTPLTPERSAAQRRLLLFAVSLAAIMYLDRVCISQSQAAISAELGLSKTDMGFAMAVFGIAYGLFEVPGGWLGDRLGPRRVLTRIVVWWSAFTIATGWAWSLWSLATIRFLFGAGEAGCFPNLTRAFTTWFQGDDRVRAQSVTWLAARWSGAFTPLVVIFALDFVTWRQSFLLFGSIGFIWAYLFFRWFRDTPLEQARADAAAAGPAAGGASPGAAAAAAVAAKSSLEGPIDTEDIGDSHEGTPWRAFFTSRSVWLLSIQYGCLAFGFWFYLTWLPTYIREVFGLKDADRYLAGFLAAFPLFLAGFSSWGTGWVTPRLAARLGSVARARRVLGFVGHGIAAAMMLVSISLTDPFYAMIAMGLSCFGADMVMPGSWTACMDMGRRYSGTLSGLMNTWGSLGGLLAPWTIPFILKAANDNWQIPMLVIAVLYAVGALCWLGIDSVTPVRDERVARSPLVERPTVA